MTTKSEGDTQPSHDGGAELNTVIHAPVRLRLCAALQMYDKVEFGGMLEVLDISKSALSKHVTTLTAAGYVEQRRAVRETRQRVWLRLTPAGRTAYHDHVAALRAIVDGQ